MAADRIVRDEVLRKQIVADQDRRLQDFSTEKIKAQILDELRVFA